MRVNKLVLQCFFVSVALSNISYADAAIVYSPYIDTLIADGITVRDTSNLANQLSLYEFPFHEAPTGISLLDNNLYLTAGNSIYKYLTNGNLINSISWFDKSITYTDVTTASGKLYATYTGDQKGITVRDLNSLQQERSFDTGVHATGIIAGTNNDLFITAGNSIYRYGTDGSLINTFSWFDNTITYTDITIQNGKLIATYTGSQHGFTVRDLNFLQQETFVHTGVSATGITKGNNNDVFITSGDGIYQYSLNGTLINRFNFGASNITYTDIAVTPVPEPQGYSLLFAGLGLIAAFARRAQKN